MNTRILSLPGSLHARHLPTAPNFPSVLPVSHGRKSAAQGCSLQNCSRTAPPPPPIPPAAADIRRRLPHAQQFTSDARGGGGSSSSSHTHSRTAGEDVSLRSAHAPNAAVTTIRSNWHRQEQRRRLPPALVRAQQHEASNVPSVIPIPSLPLPLGHSHVA